MVCFEAKEEVNATIQELTETTRYIGNKYEPKNQRKNTGNRGKIHINRAKEIEQKSSQLNTVTTEQIAQTSSSKNRSE